MTKMQFINFVVMEKWTKRQLLRQFIKLVISDWVKWYKPVKKKIKYVIMGSY